MSVACAESEGDSPSGPYVRPLGTSHLSGLGPVGHRQRPVNRWSGGHYHPAVAGGDLAHDPRFVARQPHRVEGSVDSIPRHHGQHAEHEVEDLLHLGRAHASRRTTASQWLGRMRARFPGMPPPVTWTYAWTSTWRRTSHIDGA